MYALQLCFFFFLLPTRPKKGENDNKAYNLSTYLWVQSRLTNGHQPSSFVIMENSELVQRQKRAITSNRGAGSLPVRCILITDGGFWCSLVLLQWEWSSQKQRSNVQQLQRDMAVHLFIYFWKESFRFGLNCKICSKCALWKPLKTFFVF